MTGWADIAYLRISDDRTGEAASIRRQRQQITEAAAREGITIGCWFEDKSKSAWRPGVVRDGFDALLQACIDHPVQRVWVLHDDRLIRQGDDDDLPKVIRVLAPRQIPVRCVESADLHLWLASGKMTARVVGAVNGFESDRKRERVRLAAEDRARRGGFPGGQRRFGYRQTGTRTVWHMAPDGTRTSEKRPAGPLELVAEEADAIASGYRTIAAGGTLYAVVKHWRGRGLTGPSGAEFTDITVRDVLLRAANAGLSTYRGKVVGRGDWPAIVDADTFASVRAILTDPSRRRGVGKPPTTLLAGVLRCGICARRLNGAWREGRLTYRCRSGCVTRTRDALDAAVSELVVARITMNAGKLTRPRKTASRSVAKAIGEANALRSRIEGYQLRAAEFDPADLAGVLRALRAQLAEAEAKIVQEAGKPATYALVAAGDVISAWADLDTQGRRIVIAEQIERITVGPGLPGLLPGGKPAVTHNVTVIWRKD